MPPSTPAAAQRRLPRRSRRQHLVVTAITLLICAVFWAAIYWGRRDPDPRLYERLVPVTIVLPSKNADRSGPPPPARAASR